MTLNSASPHEVEVEFRSGTPRRPVKRNTQQGRHTARAVCSCGLKSRWSRDAVGAQEHLRRLHE